MDSRTSIRARLLTSLTNELRLQVYAQRVLVTAITDAGLPLPMPRKRSVSTAMLTAARIELTCRMRFLGVIALAFIWLALALVTGVQGALIRVLVRFGAGPRLSKEDREILVEPVSFTDLALVAALAAKVAVLFA